IIHSESNNELNENLTLLHKYIEEFGDKTPKELNIIKIVESALKKSKALKIEPIKTALKAIINSIGNARENSIVISIK
ncbi:MAG: hypothetical protein L6371_04085, partial [Candidatus Atribacteria bacterium]|nr:hypothetical protein [Candidatus Atribacteria bacterium]